MGILRNIFLLLRIHFQVFTSSAPFNIVLISTACLGNVAESSVKKLAVGIILIVWLLHVVSGKRKNVIAMVALLCIQHFFVKFISFEDITIGLISLLICSLLEYPLLDFEKYNRPVYLALSKRSMFGEDYPKIVSTFSGLKHWMIVVPGFEKRGYVFHAKGTIIFDLKPCLEVMTCHEFSKIMGRMFRIGFTSKDILLKYARYTNSKMSNIRTCQQYVGINSMALVRPYGISSNLTKIHGRITFLLMMAFTILFSIFNFFCLDFKSKIDVLMVPYLCINYFRFSDPHPPSWNFSEFRKILFVVLVFVYLKMYWVKWICFDGVLTISHLIHGLIVLGMNAYYVPNFSSFCKDWIKK